MATSNFDGLFLSFRLSCSGVWQDIYGELQHFEKRKNIKPKLEIYENIEFIVNQSTNV